MTQIILPYDKVMSYLMDSLGYSRSESAHTIRALRAMDSETLHAFGIYFTTGELPQNPIHGMTVQRLMRHRHMNPVNAFLTIDWLGRKPAAAKWHLTHPMPSLAPKKAELDEIDRIAQERGWNLELPDEEDDTTDIVIA